MHKTTVITNVNFKSPGDDRLAIEALTIDQLKERAPADHFENLQRADFYRLFGVVAGTTSLMVDFSTVHAKPMDWILIRPGQIMRYDFSQPWSGWLLVFRPDQLVSNDQPDEPALAHRIDDLACLSALDATQHDWMNRSLLQIQSDCALSTDAILRNELLRLQLTSTLLRLALWRTSDLTAQLAQGKGMSKFKRFRQKLEQDFSKHHQVQYYADVLGMSEKTLSRVCLSAVGVPAKTCIAERLVLESKRLLAHTNKPVQLIGYELGFDEATNFVKFFRRITGSTPSNFRDTYSIETR
jgi:AraC-like DNA-binding protein